MLHGHDTHTKHRILGSLRRDVEAEMTPGALAKRLGEPVKPIDEGPGLLTRLDDAERRDFLPRWERR